jgi:hypothetical protein
MKFHNKQIQERNTPAFIFFCLLEQLDNMIMDLGFLSPFGLFGRLEGQ